MPFLALRAPNVRRDGFPVLINHQEGLVHCLRMLPFLTTRAWNSASTRALSCSDDLCLQSVKLAPRPACTERPLPVAVAEEGKNLHRARRVISSPQQPPLTIGGRPEEYERPLPSCCPPFLSRRHRLVAT